MIQPAINGKLTTFDALLAHSARIEVVEGRFQQKTRCCNRCGREWITYEEKETDVSIAVSLIEDGVLDRFDTALVISADSDLCPAIRALKRLRPAKRVIAAFPPNRRSDDLRGAVNAAFTVGAAKIRQAQLPPGAAGRWYWWESRLVRQRTCGEVFQTLIHEFSGC